jgi:hypothetical protein
MPEVPGPSPTNLLDRKEAAMNSIIWLVGAVVIVLAVLSLLGFG